MTREDGTDLDPAPPGQVWVYAWYCGVCGAELGEPGDPEPPQHCGPSSIAWEWALMVDASYDPDAWREEECFRASGEAICVVCGKRYWQHPQPAKDDVPTLVRACDGRLLKL